MKLLLPSNLHWSPDAFEGAEAHVYDPSVPLPQQHLDAEGLVAWGVPDERLRHAATSMPNLQWVQTLAAGAEGLLRVGFAEHVTLTSGRGLHDRPVAEHALALLLACARRLPKLRDAQKEHRWAGELGGIQALRPGKEFCSLLDARVTIWGFGSIARRLAPLLTALGAEVQGVARHGGKRDGVEVVERSEAPRLLARTDALVMILPKTSETEGALDREMLTHLPRHAWVVNVGRGGTLDEEALAEALRSGRIAGAALDVFEEEPLPPTSPLWDLDNLLITPHSAGGRPVGAQTLVAENLERFQKGRELVNTIDRERGY